MAEPAHLTLTEALEHWAGIHPQKKVWTYLDESARKTSQTVTYRGLDEKTKALGRALLDGAKGRAALSPGDRVLLVYPPSIHFIVAFVACVRVGLVAVPVYPPDPRRLRKHIQAFSKTAASCGATVALTSSMYDHAKKASAIKAKLTGDDTRWPDDLRWIVTDKPLPSAPGASTAAVAEEEAKGAGGQGVVLERNSLAFLQYTSGSTGDPKGVKITHGNLAHNLREIVKELKADDETVVVSWLPQYHDMGLIGSLLGTMYCGGTGYYMSPLDFVRSPPVWVFAVGRYQATHLQLPNFGFALTVRKWKSIGSQPAVDLSRVVHIINAAEPIDAASMDAFEETFGHFGLRKGVIKPTYGMAEHTVFVCSGGEQRLRVERDALEISKEVKLAPGESTSSDSPPSNASSELYTTIVGCGFPSRVEGMEILIVEPESRRSLPEDRVGEIWIRSPSKAHGYWGLPERSRETFCAIPAPPDASESTVETHSDPIVEGAETPQSVAVAGETIGTPPEMAPAVKGVATEAAVSLATEDEEKKRENDEEGLEIDVTTTEDSNVVAPEFHCKAEGADSGMDVSQGFLRTGDEGFLHGGEVFICGRIKDLIIVGGRNHYPQDIERTVERERLGTIRPGCSAAFSVPGSGETSGEVLVLAAEIREDQVKASEEQRRQLAEEIRASVVSEHGVGVGHVLLLAPRENIKTTSGKIARQWCRKAFLEGKMKPLVHLESGGDVTLEMQGGKAFDPQTGEAVVAPTKQSTPAWPLPTLYLASLSNYDIIARLQEGLTETTGDGSTTSPDAPFHTLGVSSMAAAQFSGRLEQEYGVVIPISILDEDNTTLRSLVGLIRSGGVGGGGDGAIPRWAEVSVAANVEAERTARSEAMHRETLDRFEQNITNNCPCCMCLLYCPCC